MDYLVDMQGFKRPDNQFVLKELALLPLTNDNKCHPCTFLFLPPCQWHTLPAKYKCMNAWVERNYHGLPWNSGDVPYYAAEEILKVLLIDAAKIYVKGYEKRKWLEEIIGSSRTIVDLNEEKPDCPSLRKMLYDDKTLIPCPYHSDGKFNCAAKNVQLLKKNIF